jgi:diacylglycerol kinase (ATP)
MRIRIVINPAAGKAEPVLTVLNDVFGPAGIDWDVALTHGAGDGVAAAREAADQGFDLVGAYGGDGTVAEVASALAEGGPPILLLPGGTGNALAADLGIPPRLADAAALAVGDAGEIRRVDLGRAGERWFALRLTMGFEAAMVGAATREMKDRYGWLAYALTGLQTLSNLPIAKYSMTIDGQAVECEGLAAVVANSAGIGVAGVRFTEDVDVSDGVLDVVVLQVADLRGLLGSAADAAKGQQPRLLSRWRGKEIHVEASPPQAVLADGEDAGVTPVDVTIVPGAVGVVVPKAVGSQLTE